MEFATEQINAMRMAVKEIWGTRVPKKAYLDSTAFDEYVGHIGRFLEQYAPAEFQNLDTVGKIVLSRAENLLVSWQGREIMAKRAVNEWAKAQGHEWRVPTETGEGGKFRKPEEIPPEPEAPKRAEDMGDLGEFPNRLRFFRARGLPSDEALMEDFAKVTGNTSTYAVDVIKQAVLGNPVYLAGEAGLGKTYLGECVTKYLGLEMHLTQSPQMATDLIGYIGLSEKHVETEFTRAIEHGGVNFLEEVDRCIPECTNVANSAIANGIIGIPGKGMVHVHEDCIFMATGNTAGMGQTPKYNTAVQLDRAFMDRMAVIWVEWEHDVALQLAKNDKKLVAFCESYREAHAKNRCDGGDMSYRAVISMTKAKGLMPFEKILDQNLIKRQLGKDSLMRIANDMKCKNEYAIQFKEMVSCMTE